MYNLYIEIKKIAYWHIHITSICYYTNFCILIKTIYYREYVFIYYLYVLTFLKRLKLFIIGYVFYVFIFLQRLKLFIIEYVFLLQK